MIDRVVVLNDVSIARGGATALALASVRALRGRGIAVTFITGDDGNNPELVDLGVEIVPLAQRLLLDAGASGALFRGLYNSKTVSVVGSWISNHDTPRTIYHIHTWAKVLSPSLFRALRPVGKRLLVSAHDFFLVCPNGGYVFYNSGEVCQLRPMSVACVRANCDRRSYAQKLWRVARQAVRSALTDFENKPPLVLAVHDGMREPLERGGLPAHAIRVLRNPIRAFAQRRIAAENQREAVFIGRLSVEKGVDLAVEAAALAGVALRVIGEGPLRESLSRKHPNVVFEGQLGHQEIGQRIASARVLLMPSRYPEPFGLVAGEAMWSGLPVIVSNTALIADEVVERGAGLACDLKKRGALAAQLSRMFGDDRETERMSRNAFSETSDLAHTYATWADALIGIYEERADKADTYPSRP